MIRVLLVEDHTSLLEALSHRLGREGDVQIVGQARTLAELHLIHGSADVIILDLHLPDADGAPLVRSVVQARPDAAVLVLTGGTNRDDIADALAAGARSALHKSASVEQILNAVRQVSRGQSPAPAHFPDGSANALFERLTPREREVLKVLAEGSTDREIAETLHVGIETVRTHVTNILGKLEVTSRLQAVVLAIRSGAVQTD